MKNTLLIFLIVLSINSYCQNDSVHVVPPATSGQVTINMPETLTLKTDNGEKDSSLISEKNMPWIVALIIGLISAIVNMSISYSLRKSNEKNLLQQINNTKDITLMQLKATLGAKNRQDWIDELRHILSDCLAYTTQMSRDSELTAEEKIRYGEKLAYAKFKIELMINLDKKEQRDLMESIEKLLRVAAKPKSDTKVNEIRDARADCIDHARKLFEIHWNKIKNLK